MIIVLGSIHVREDALDEALRLSFEHVQRSRREPGCISHAVHRDAEEPGRLVFVERWESMEALEQHFLVPESGAFVGALAQCATAAPEMEIYDAGEPLRRRLG